MGTYGNLTSPLSRLEAAMSSLSTGAVTVFGETTDHRANILRAVRAGEEGAEHGMSALEAHSPSCDDTDALRRAWAALDEMYRPELVPGTVWGVYGPNWVRRLRPEETERRAREG